VTVFARESERIMRLEDRVAVVTGGARGIGLAIARRYAAEGARVVIADVDAAAGGAAAAALSPTQCRFVATDVGSARDAENLVAEACRQFGALDILVNNAGIEKHAAFVEVTEADYDKVLAVNLKGAFFVTQAFVRHLLADKRPGKIINISSVHEEMPFPGFSTYCASKGGMQLLTRDLAVELGPYGITVNGIAPGAIATEINRALLDDKPRVERLLQQIPLGRMGKPEDVAALAAFLASPDADYVTGSTYYVDGGPAWDYRE
jgi:glucose 1-dehydrogenase